MPTIRNIIIFVAIGAALVFAYIFFVKPSAPEGNLVSSSASSSTSSATSSSTATTAGSDNPTITKDLLNLLLSVKTIELKDGIFSDPAFLSLHDSSISLAPDGTEGRVNPFAPLGTDPVTPLAPVAPTAQ